MHQHPVQLFRDIGIYLFEVVHAVVEHDVHIVLGQTVEGLRGLTQQPIGRDVPPARDEQQHVPEAEEVVAEAALAVAIVEVEVDPAVSAGRVILDDVVAPDIAMFLVVLMQKTDRLDDPDELVEQRRIMIIEKILVVPAQLERQLAERLALDIVQDAELIARRNRAPSCPA